MDTGSADLRHLCFIQYEVHSYMSRFCFLLIIYAALWNCNKPQLVVINSWQNWNDLRQSHVSCYTVSPLTIEVWVLSGGRLNDEKSWHISGFRASRQRHCPLVYSLLFIHNIRIFNAVGTFWQQCDALMFWHLSTFSGAHWPYWPLVSSVFINPEVQLRHQRHYLCIEGNTRYQSRGPVSWTWSWRSLSWSCSWS